MDISNDLARRTTSLYNYATGLYSQQDTTTEIDQSQTVISADRTE